MECIILGGGFGTRLQHIVNNVPKPMALVNGKPFLEYLIRNLVLNGFNHIILAVGYKSEVITEYFGNEYKGIKISYSIEKEPLGTGGAVIQALELSKSNPVFIVNGDTFFEIDYKGMCDFYRQVNADIVIATKRMVNYNRYGTVLVNGTKIVTFEEKTQKSEGLINGGIYLVNKDILEANRRTKQFSFEREILESLDYEVFSYSGDGYFIDIGVPEDYYRANEDLGKR